MNGKPIITGAVQRCIDIADFTGGDYERENEE